MSECLPKVPADLRERTMSFALDVIRYCGTLPKTNEYAIITRQLMRAATSVGANYRSAQRGKSHNDFIAKLAIVEEEADESMYWLELIERLRAPSPELLRLKGEANQLVAIIVTSKKKARAAL
jgi:four helix bundle protein